jgi:hypothetical protein
MMFVRRYVTDPSIGPFNRVIRDKKMKKVD